ncbi:MAG TPA: VWA domain-containing protein [Phycisphaerae bacterium]|nr:VWA domain-containing protein [Phycisphaerae bacterium]
MRPMRMLLTAAAVGLLSAGALADGMIVPVRPDVRVRGSWTVKYHRVDIKVRDQVAFVNIDQEFVNTGRGMIEVEYLFPVPPDSAIDAMTLVVNGKEYAAKLYKADEARKIYEDIVRKKKDPALLEYAGFGLYRTKAFPLEPGKPARVVVSYKGVCKKDRNVMEVWYPLNTEKFSAKALKEVEVRVDIKTAADITTVYSPTHEIKCKHKDDDPRHVIAIYSDKDVLPTADFQVFVKTSDKDVGATMMTYQPYGEKDGYFMLLVSPNPRAARRKIVPKDIVVVFDHSGSMGGKKLQQTTEAVEYILRHLNPDDRFNVIGYNDQTEAVFKGLVAANRKNIDQAVDWVDRVEASAGTNIHEALQVAMDMLPERRNGRPKYVIFLTDGVPTTGKKTEEKDILIDTRKANDTKARLFCFGVGYDVNVRLLDKLADENRGRSGYAREKESVEPKITSLYNKIKNPVMTELALDVKGLRLRDKYPREMGDLFDGDQIVLVGRYDARDVQALSRGEGKYRTTLLIEGIYEGRQKTFEYSVEVNPPGRDLRFEFVEKLWAIRRVGYLLDQVQLHGESKEVVDEIVRLSRDYGIITPYTSFLADERTRLAGGREVRAKAGAALSPLRDQVEGAAGQMGALARQSLNYANKVVTTQPGAVAAAGDGVVLHGNASKDAYEAAQHEIVRGLRQIGNNAVYRRGKVWIASNAADVDLTQDAAKVQIIQRFSDEYFKLIRENDVADNQIMASQRADEELVVKLRGQVYHVK